MKYSHRRDLSNVESLVLTFLTFHTIKFTYQHCTLTPSYPSKRNIFIFMVDRDLISIR